MIPDHHVRDGHLCPAVMCVQFSKGTAKDLLKSCHLVCTALIGHDLNSLTQTLAGLQEGSQADAYMCGHACTKMQISRCKTQLTDDCGGGGGGGGLRRTMRVHRQNEGKIENKRRGE